MTIRSGRPLAVDHPEGTGLSQVIICHPRHPSHICQDPDSISWTFVEKIVLFFTLFNCSALKSARPLGNSDIKNFFDGFYYVI